MFRKKGSKICLVWICLSLVGLLRISPFVSWAEEAKTKGRLAILPFENMSGQFLPIDVIMADFYECLEDRFDLALYEDVDEVTMRMRLRHTGFLNSGDVSEIGRRLGVDAILLGIICEYQESPEPKIGMILKMIGTEEGTPIIWMETGFISGNQNENWFGRGRFLKTDSLVKAFAADLLKAISIHPQENQIEQK